MRSHQICALALALALSAPLAACRAPAGGEEGGEEGRAKGARKGGGKRDKGGAKGGAKEGAEGGEEERAVPVEAVAVTRGDISAVVRAIAVVEPLERATLRALTAGVVTTLAAEEGDRVRPKQRLAQLPRPGAGSLLAKAGAALAKARADAARLKGLADRGLAPVEELRQAEFQRDQSALELRRLREEALNERVESPIAGVVTRREVHRGEAVSAGQVMFEVMDLRALRVPLLIPDQWSAQLREGLAVRLYDRRGALLTDAARVERVSPVVEAESGTVRVLVAPPEGLAALKPGLFVSAEVVLDTARGALVLPKQALIYKDDAPWVVLANGDAARATQVTLGYAQGDLVEVRAPLKEGDLVVSFGQRGLEDGARLSVPRR